MAICELAEMNATGDTKTKWDSDNKDEVEVAKNTFETLKKKGHSIFRTDKKGEPSERMTEFDPKAESMIAIPKVVGG